MLNEEILKTIRERGLLLEREVFEMILSFDNPHFAVNFLEQLERLGGSKIITKSLISKNIEFVKNLTSSLDKGENLVEETIIKLGLKLEVEKRASVVLKKQEPFKIFYADTKAYKKLEVPDFINHFRARYHQMQRILMHRPELTNLISINKLGSDRQNVSIIGILSEKRTTANKNLMLTFEDLTGSIKVLVRADKKEIYDKAEELQLDDVVGIKASGNKDFLFVQDIFFPDSFLFQKTSFEEDVNVAFLSDVHCGSDRHLGESMYRFLDWLKSDNVDAKKIKYIFFSGDNVDGVGIFPGQENLLTLKSMKEQYSLLASYLREVPKNITMFMCPGQHDAVRVAEPQPLIDKNYAPELYQIENLVLVTNPAYVYLVERDKEFKILMYHGASIHSFINEIKELREIKAHRTPARAVKHMLKRRHLAPTHSSVVYIPNEYADPLMIKEVPDVLCTGEVHRLDIQNYNGVLIITGSCWQAQTPFEEKVGNIPDPCKVPVLNLKTREIKVFDFGSENENK